MKYSARKSVTLADANWARYDATAFTPVGMPSRAPLSTDVCVSLWPVTLTTADLSVFEGERTGDSDAGTAGWLVIPDIARAYVAAALHGATWSLGNLTVTFINANGSSSGTTVDVFGKTRAAVVAEVVALTTIANTGIADIEAVAGNAPGMILLQSDASDATAAAWAKGADPSLRLFSLGLTSASAAVLANADSIYPAKTVPGRQSTISIRGNGAVVVLEAVFEPSGEVGR